MLTRSFILQEHQEEHGTWTGLREEKNWPELCAYKWWGRGAWPFWELTSLRTSTKPHTPPLLKHLSESWGEWAFHTTTFSVSTKTQWSVLTYNITAWDDNCTKLMQRITQNIKCPQPLTVEDIYLSRPQSRVSEVITDHTHLAFLFQPLHEDLRNAEQLISPRC